jgi:hypothetical protein
MGVERKRNALERAESTGDGSLFLTGESSPESIARMARRGSSCAVRRVIAAAKPAT